MQLSQATAILSRDVYAYFGDQITKDISTNAAKRIYEKSADYKAKAKELAALGVELTRCKFEFDLPLSELSGGGESGTEGITRIRGFYLFAGVVSEYDIVRNRYQNSRGIVTVEQDENGKISFSRVGHTESGLLIRFTGLKSTMVGDMQQFPVGYGNAGRHYFELGGLSDQQIVAIERALAGGEGEYSLKISFSVSPKLYKWVYAFNPVEGDVWQWVVDTKNVEIRLVDSSGKVVKSWR